MSEKILKVMNEEILKSYIKGLEGIIDNLKIKQDGFGFVTDKPKYHIDNSSVAKLLRTVSKAIDYDDNYRSYGPTPRERLYWTFNGHGSNSPEEIKDEISKLVEAAKQSLSAEH